MTFDYTARIGRLREIMAAHSVDVAVVGVGPDLRYLTGYEGVPSERLTALVLGPAIDPVLFVPALEASLVRANELEVLAWEETEEPVALVGSVASSPSRVAVGDHLWSVFLTKLLVEWPVAEWLPVSVLMKRLRMRKEPAEIELLRQAAHGIDRVMERIPTDIVFAGRSERDVARDLAELTVDEGHDVAQFSIVASGANGASPHHHPGGGRMTKGDLVVCDFGGRREGYFSDCTRTFVIGEATEEQLEIHSVVLEANRAGRAFVQSGRACEEVDRAVRKVIEEAGYGERFIHRTGHGIGLEVHEHPYIVEGNREPLDDGMCFSIEPGIYMPGRFGVRIEDIVVCLGAGAETLNGSDRSLVSVG